MSDTIESWLNAEVVQRGWSLREVARRVGVSHTTIVKLANGQARPSISLCRELARVFGVPYQDLLRMSGVLPDEVSAQDSDDRAVSYLLERLMGLEHAQRQETVTLMNLILDYRQAAGAQPPAPKNGRRRRNGEKNNVLPDDPEERRRLFRSLWDALTDEDREEVYQEIQRLLAAQRGQTNAPASDQ